METLNELDDDLNKSENLIDIDRSNKDLTAYIRRHSSRIDIKDIKLDQSKSSDLLSLLEHSSVDWNVNNFNSDITNGLKSLVFDSGLSQDEIQYKFLRSRSHALYTSACIHACYFVGVANRIRRNLDQLKRGDDLSTNTKNSLLMNEMRKSPGLQIGIIGGGKLGRQLAESLLEFSQVYPNELQISTRQPDSLTNLKEKNVRCYFDNFKLAGSVNIIFLCVLSSQLQLVVSDIKKNLPDKCIIYSLVRTESPTHLKNLLGDLLCNVFILKPHYEINKKFDGTKIKYNHISDIIESINSNDLVKMFNPFSENKNDSIVQVNEFFPPLFVYSIMNICAFLNLNKKETLGVLAKFVFHNSVNDLDETLFFDTISQSQYFPIINLVDASQNPTRLFFALSQNNNLRLALSKHYLEFLKK